MNIKHLKKEHYTTGAWSGGSTTQLYIYPEDGDYSKRQFKARISSATVELDESDFTPLPGVVRYITPLKGGFTLTHPGRPAIVMEPLDAPYKFDGGTATHSVGRATDFNLMLKGIDGSMEVLTGGCPLGQATFIYPVGGGIIKIEGQTFELADGDMLAVFEGVGRAAFDKAIVCNIGR